MRSFTQAQLEVLTRKPVWLEKAAPKMAARVFAGSEGWMIQPDKVHPEGKTIPPYCIYTIPNLDKYMEAGSPAAQVSTSMFLTDVSYTRRSATRYTVNISLGEQLYASGGDVTFTLNTVNADETLTSGNVYTLLSGNTTGRLQFDLRFGGDVGSLSIDADDVTFTGNLVDNGDRSISMLSKTSSLGTLTIL